MKHFLKKVLTLAMPILLLTSISGWAQDIITLKSGEDVKAKILEVTPTEIKYKNFDNQQGPTFTTRKSDILMITYENGQREMISSSGGAFSSDDDRIWASNPELVKRGMKYKELKKYYNAKDYYSLPGDEYSTSRWLWNLLLPGLGQMTMEEGGRGAAYLLGSIGASLAGYLGGSAIMAAGMDYDGYIDDTAYGTGYLVVLAGAVGSLIIDIMSMVDAANVAKVKDLYYRDLKNLASTYEIKVSPYVAPVKLGNSVQTVAGLSLTMNF